MEGQLEIERVTERAKEVAKEPEPSKAWKCRFIARMNFAPLCLTCGHRETFASGEDFLSCASYPTRDEAMSAGKEWEDSKQTWARWVGVLPCEAP